MLEEYVVNEIGMEKEELLLAPNLEETFYTIFARRVYKGKKEAQEEIENFEENCLISGMAVKKAFSKVSEVKCDTYLSFK